MKNKLTIQTLASFERIQDSLKHDAIQDDLDAIIENLTELLNKATEIKDLELQNVTGDYQ